MKRLKEILVDYDMAQLRALAQKRGLTPPSSRGREALSAFAEELLSPASIAITVADLSAEEKAALETLIAAGGFMPAPQFARQYGSIRPMGTGKMLREAAWENPVGVTEGLWYRGLIFKGFHHTVNGPEEIFFIPTDLQVLLPFTPAQRPSFQVSLSTIPAHIYASAVLPAREDLFNLLVYLQSNIVNLTPDQPFPADHRQAISALFYRAEFSPADEHSAVALEHWFEFLLHLAGRMDFLHTQARRLKLNTPVVKHWLSLTAWEQARRMQDAWRNDPTWNDLWHVPALRPQPTGWENSPLLGRSKILHYLGQLPPDEWINLAAFGQAIKRTEPDFQRPGGDYKSWYLYNAQGEPLMGFEHWEAVEGALINHLIGVILFSMGVVDLGGPIAGAPPAVFKITRLGQAFFSPQQTIAPVKKPAPVPLRFNPADFSVKVPASFSLYDRFQLARLAEMVKREDDHVVYRLTRRSYERALAQSITLEQMLSFLNRATRAQAPLALLEALRGWDRRSHTVLLESIVVIRVNEPDILAELRRHPQIGPLLGPSIDAQTVIVPQKNVPAVQNYLQEAGYLQ